MRGVIVTVLVLVGLVVSGCGGDTSATAPALPQRSVEVAGVSVAASPERIDASGAVLRLTLDTHTTPLNMDLPGAAELFVGGRQWPVQTWTGTGPGGHHREGTLRFGAGGPASGTVRLVLGGLGAPVELTWPEVAR
jgi:hypothetical protein